MMNGNICHRHVNYPCIDLISAIFVSHVHIWLHRVSAIVAVSCILGPKIIMNLT